MMDTTKGLKGFLAGMDARKSRGWTVHNEFDYFTLCPRCGHWFDCRNPESLVRHSHPATESIVVTTVVQSGEIGDAASQLQNQTSPSNVTIETPNLRNR